MVAQVDGIKHTEPFVAARTKNNFSASVFYGRGQDLHFPPASRFKPNKPVATQPEPPLIERWVILR